MLRPRTASLQRTSSPRWLAVLPCNIFSILHRRRCARVCDTRRSMLRPLPTIADGNIAGKRRRARERPVYPAATKINGGPLPSARRPHAGLTCPGTAGRLGPYTTGVGGDKERLRGRRDDGNATAARRRRTAMIRSVNTDPTSIDIVSEDDRHLVERQSIHQNPVIHSPSARPTSVAFPRLLRMHDRLSVVSAVPPLSGGAMTRIMEKLVSIAGASGVTAFTAAFCCCCCCCRCKIR